MVFLHALMLIRDFIQQNANKILYLFEQMLMSADTILEVKKTNQSDK